MEYSGKNPQRRTLRTVREVNSTHTLAMPCNVYAEHVKAANSMEDGACPEDLDVYRMPMPELLRKRSKRMSRSTHAGIGGLYEI